MVSVFHRLVVSAAFVLFPVAAFGQQRILLIPVFDGFAQPVDIQSPGDGTGRLFVAEQGGTIRVVRNGAVLPEPFLDISGLTNAGGERGLLGMAFPPDFAIKQHFYVNYTDLAGDTVIARYDVSGNPDVADANSEKVLLTQDQPAANHNGGQLQFGPDGYLYVGLGDGGVRANAQDPQTLLGKMLRIDVESNLAAYQIPSDNPFVDDPGVLDEIWALGLRNPWRFSLDRAAGHLWIADVGENDFEEVSFQPAASPGGENYGWSTMEGFECVIPGCDTSGLKLPVVAYEHPVGAGRSVTGGYAYRGNLFPGVRGLYVYGDFISGEIWAARFRLGAGWVSARLIDSGLNVSTFGETAGGELLVADHGSGTIYLVWFLGQRADPPQ